MVDSPSGRSTAPTEARPARVLFARIGWMTYYAGPQAGDERPRGGGAYTKKSVGHEIFNFADIDGRLYGFVRAKNQRVALERVDPTAGSAGELDETLVIFVARQRVVGWYSRALVHRTSAPFVPDVLRIVRGRLKQAGTKGFKIEGYRFGVSKDNAVLLPTRERTHRIPGNVKGGFGQSNVCYPYDRNGKHKTEKWVDDAVSYVLKYAKQNLLRDPAAEDISDEAAVISRERAAGFQSNPEIRKAVEDFAMARAKDVLEHRGFSNFWDTSRTKPYDYVCDRAGKTFFVEVKGTQSPTPVKSVILTKGEVAHVQSNRDQCIFVLVHTVRVSRGKKITVSGGISEVREPWRLEQSQLAPLQYTWTVT